jgi:hypothetical protein
MLSKIEEFKSVSGTGEKNSLKKLTRLFRSLSLQQFFLQDIKNVPFYLKPKNKSASRGKSFDYSEKSKDEEENHMCDSTSSSLKTDKRESSTTSFQKQSKNSKIT